MHALKSRRVQLSGFPQSDNSPVITSTSRIKYYLPLRNPMESPSCQCPVMAILVSSGCHTWLACAMKSYTKFNTGATTRTGLCLLLVQLALVQILELNGHICLSENVWRIVKGCFAQFWSQRWSLLCLNCPGALLGLDASETCMWGSARLARCWKSSVLLSAAFWDI